LRGRIRDSDYPSEASRTGTQGSLTTRYVIGPTGRITDCTVIKSSGSAVLDETTCRLVMQRYRYEPARDAQGRRVSDTDVEEHSWVLVD
jgi:protein TonB